MGQTNVIAMPSRPNITKALPLVLPLDDLDHTREALTQIEVATALSIQVLDKAEEHGEEAAMNGVREIFLALSTLLTPSLIGLTVFMSECVDLDGVCNLIL